MRVVARGLNLARVRALGLTARPRSLHPDESENHSRVLIRVARAKIRALSPSFRIIRVPGRAPRLLPVKFAWHKQSEILKHCRTKCDNSAWLLTPLDRMYPSRAAHAGGFWRSRRERKTLEHADSRDLLPVRIHSSEIFFVRILATLVVNLFSVRRDVLFPVSDGRAKYREMSN